MDLRSRFEGARVLVTGGLGFIGSNLAHWLVDAGAHVTLVDSLIPEYGGNQFNVEDIRDRVQINISDVRDAYSMRYLVRNQDYLFNLAGQTSHLDSMQDPYTDLEINCRSQLSILEACRHENPSVRLVFASTRQVYGKPDYLPVDEEHPIRPVDVNGINKLAGEWYHILYSRIYGIPACSLRLTNTYGPRMRIRDERQTFVGVWIRCLVEGKAFEVWDGSQQRDFTYVDDAVLALLMAATNDAAKGKVFNLGGCEAVSLTQLAEILVQVHGDADFVETSFPHERKRIDIGDFFADYSFIRSTIGWEPKVTLREGLKRTLDYYHKHLHYYV